MIRPQERQLPALVLRERDRIRRIAAIHGAENVRVFGSAVDDEEGALRDLDLLVDMRSGRSLLDLIALDDELSAALGMEVDVVTEAALSPYLRDRITAEAVAL